VTECTSPAFTAGCAREVADELLYDPRHAMEPIPLLDLRPLFGPDGHARQATDADIMAAAQTTGVMLVMGLPEDVPSGPEALRELFRVFDLPAGEQRRLWRRAAAPENENVYRGVFPIESGIIKYGIDIGPEHAVASRSGDALAEPTPMPPERALPGWRALVRRSFTGLESVGRALLRSLARGLGLPEDFHHEAFAGGNSTLRLIVYPPWPELAAGQGLALRPTLGPDGVRRYDIGGEHVDSGFVTLLQQDATGGLQARLVGETWVDVPPMEGTLVVNFGKLLERWTGGSIRATEHRVLGNDRARRSVPFFYEPRIDARIAPLPIASATPFEPFRYGDHLWQAMSKFSEFQNARRWPDNGPSGR